MTSKKTFITCIIIAILGSIILHKLSAPSSLSFILGIIAAALVFSRNNSSTTSTKTSETSASTPATQTLYVGNLPYKANESHVRDLFAQYGQVNAVRLMKDKRTGKRRGFGFVVVAKQDTDQIIDAVNELEYMERTLKVRVANDPKHPETEKF